MISQKKALVVSSDPALVDFLQDSLFDRGFLVAGAGTRDKELMAVLEEEAPDIVVIDIMMPLLSGLEVSLSIRQQAQVPIIMVSAWNADEGKVRGLDLTAEDYLTEPFGAAELVSLIEVTLRRNRNSKEASCDASCEPGVRGKSSFPLWWHWV